MDTSQSSNSDSRSTASSTDPSQATEAQLSTIDSLLESLDGKSGSTQITEDVTKQNQLVQVRLGLASSLFLALRAKHAWTAAHSLRVALGCSSWSMAIDLPDEVRDAIEVSALLHDIGKIGVPDRILLKPEKLTREEVETVARNRSQGIDILQSCCSSNEILDIVSNSQAWFDGSKPGFDRLGSQLPHGSRMIAIVDAFDAMTTNQVYRRAMSRELALTELFQFAGTQFDPQMVQDFASLTSLDQTKLHGRVMQRWLQQLDPAASNASWQLGEASTAVPSKHSNVDSLFHEKLLENMHDGVIFVDSRMAILLWNRGAERLTDITANSIYQKRWTPSLVNMRDHQGNKISDAECPVECVMRTGVQLLRRLTIKGRSEQEVSVNAQIVPMLGSDGSTHGAALILHDASSVITLEERVQSLHEQAIQDPLTKVANRAEFDRVLEMFIETHLEQMLPCSLVMCDLDHFKKINDTYGHQAGDDALVSFAALLKRTSRTGDLVARYGGEEFVLLCADCDNATATKRAEQIRRELASMPIDALQGQCITASFGVTEIQGGDNPETMIRRSDRALFQAKEIGRNTVVQLGSGLRASEDAPPTARITSSVGEASSKILLQRDLVTVMPSSITLEKIRGFAADHHATIVSNDDSKIVILVDEKPTLNWKRRNDRVVPILIELQMTEENIESTQSAGLRAKGVKRTVIHVSIFPKKNRDRRQEEIIIRSRQLLMSLKSYLMAHEYGLNVQTQQNIPESRSIIDFTKSLLTPWKK